AQNPQFADFAPARGASDPQRSSRSAQAHELLREIALSLTGLAELAGDLPPTLQTTQALDRCEAALSTIRAALAREAV
ncbi:MAG: hypothetical protein RLZZ387_2919, partial [Chloroflexota bacterium]